MLVLAAVPRSFAAQLQRAAGHRFRFLGAGTWSEAVQFILKEPLEMAVVDPGLEGVPRTQEIERIRVLFPSLPLVVYTNLTPGMVGVLLRLGRVGVRGRATTTIRSTSASSWSTKLRARCRGVSSTRSRTSWWTARASSSGPSRPSCGSRPRSTPCATSPTGPAWTGAPARAGSPRRTCRRPAWS
jgi:hypothetical protein